MLRLPKVSDPANLMERNSLFRGTAPQQRYIGCPSAQLFNPQINPSVGKVENLMTMSRSEMADLIAKQQGEAEKVIQNLRENQQEQLEAPASAMELYYMSMLKNIRQKEQAEIDNAYLTQQQKNDLQASALARKAGLDGNLVRRADELAELDTSIADNTRRLLEKAVEDESRMAMTADPGAASASGEPDEMTARTAASMASAGGAAAAAAVSAPSFTADDIQDFTTDIDSLRRDFQGRGGENISKRQFLLENGKRLQDQLDTLVSNLQQAGVITGSRTNYIRRMGEALRSQDATAVTRIFNNVKESIRRAGRRLE